MGLVRSVSGECGELVCRFSGFDKSLVSLLLPVMMKLGVAATHSLAPTIQGDWLEYSLAPTRPGFPRGVDWTVGGFEADGADIRFPGSGSNFLPRVLLDVCGGRNTYGLGYWV